MDLDHNNPVVRLCIEGMDREGLNDAEGASTLFHKAWDVAQNSEEKYIAAHYLARQQPNPESKLVWDSIALEHALLSDNTNSRSALSSLYLNIGKGHEDLGQHQAAGRNYQLALQHSHALHDDGYGKLIKNGILAGLRRVQSSES